MKIFITILLFAIAFTSCSHKIVLGTTTVTKDSTSTTIEYKYKDTVISTPAKTIHIHDTIPCPEVDYEREAIDSTGTLRTTVKIKKGVLDVDCHNDSLMQRIAWLEKNMYSLNSISVSKEIFVPVDVIKWKIPKWVWWLLAYALGLTIWTFRKPILALIKNNV
jgi:hypothetical protein